MQLTILPDKIDRPKAARVAANTIDRPMVAANTIKQANYPASNPRHEPVLRGLVESWITAECRFDRWQEANPKQAQTLSRETSRWRLLFAAGGKGKPLPIISSYERIGTRGRIRNTQEYSGYQAFAAFLLCAAPRFAVGKCDRCHKFYWNRWGHRNKRFCGRKCEGLGTATERQARRTAKQRREKNSKIKKAVDAFFWDKPATQDWKAWVANHAGVTISYLTRSFNRGIQGKPGGLKLARRQQAHLSTLKRTRKGK